MGSPFGMRDSTFDMLQMLFCMYTQTEKCAEAYEIGIEIVAFLKPFRLRSPLYLTAMVKNNPMTLLGPAGFDNAKEFMEELRAVSMIQNGGGWNIMFDRYQLDFKCKGA